MMYEGKEVWTEENFSYQTVKVGDYVEQAVVDNAMDCLPPACMTSRCSQMGEPYSHREDPETGEFRATYTTFKRVGGEWPHIACGFFLEGGAAWQRRKTGTALGAWRTFW